MKFKLTTLLLTLILILTLVPAALADDGEGEEINYYCTDLENLRHPVGARIAERYQVDYVKVMTWFCQGEYGFGQIMLALETSKVMNPNDGTVFDLQAYAESLLLLKSELGGWGEVWKSLGFNGRPKGPDWSGGPPPWAGPKDDDDKEGSGPPPWAGPKDDDDDDEGSGPPPWAGPKDDDDDDEGSGQPPRDGPKDDDSDDDDDDDDDEGSGPPPWAGPKNKHPHDGGKPGKP